VKSEKNELARRAAERAREMLHSGEPQAEILTMLVNTAEHLAGKNSVCSILRVDDEGLLRNAASPNLPTDYLAAIDRLKPNPQVGTCAAAAATGSVVVTCDFQLPRASCADAGRNGKRGITGRCSRIGAG
jgi:hypothetical protein